MRVFFVVLLTLGFAACASGPQPLGPDAARAMFVRAVDEKLSGNARGAEDLLLELAHRAPDTRAGAHARALLSSGSAGLTTVSYIGILAGIAIPNFIRYQERSKEIRDGIEAPAEEVPQPQGPRADLAD